MTDERASRKMSAILSADVKGYSRLMGDDEAETVEFEVVDEHVDCAYRIVLGHVIIEPGWEQGHLSAIGSFHKASHRNPRCDSLHKSNMTMGSSHTAWAHLGRVLLHLLTSASEGEAAIDCCR